MNPMPDTTTIVMNSTVSELHQDIRVLRAKLEDFCQSFQSGWDQTADARLNHNNPEPNELYRRRHQNQTAA